jgi:uncharacterized DUF497 family protein
MKLCWDEAKRKSNLRKHRLDFARAQEVLEGGTWDFPDDSHSIEENRWISVGWLDGVLVVIVRTEWEDDCARIISMRKAAAGERRLYGKEIH